MRPGPPTVKGQRRRDELLKAAQDVFEREGYFDTRVTDIVTQAHVSHGTFYVYFDSKDDILRCLIDQLVEELYVGSTEEEGLHEASAYAQLEATIRQFMAVYKANAKMMRILEQVVAFDDEVREIRLGIILRFTERIKAAIVAFQARGGDPDLDPAHAAQALGGMVGDYAFACYVLKQDIDERVAIATMARIWAKAVGIPIDASVITSKPAPRRRKASV